MKLAWAACLALPSVALAARAKNVTALNTDSFPKLPDVSVMVGAAKETLSSVSTQANSLEARLKQVQSENEFKLSRQKQIFEQKLRVQETHNQDQVKMNEAISKEIGVLKANNTELRKRAQQLQEGNRQMRTELKTLQNRLLATQDFAANALKATDDSQAPELEVLRPHAGHAARAAPHQNPQTVVMASKRANAGAEQESDSEDKEDADEKDSDEEEDDSAASFLAVAEHRQRESNGASEMEMTDSEPASSPGDLVAILSRGVTDLQKEEKESEAKLKTMFLTSFKTGTKRHATLLSQQRALNGTRSTLQALQQKLQAADQRLEVTRDGLQQKLRSLGLYAQKLSHLALANASEVPHLMQALPQEVTVAAPVPSS